MDRVSVVGSSGSGKSTVAAALAGLMGAEHIELDSIHHLPGWESLAVDRFRAEVDQRTAGPRWVVDGNYGRVIDIVWDRADTIVWLDLPKRVVMWRLAWRTFRRGLLRKQLWNGNRERLANFFRLDPEKSVIVWAWTHWAEYQRRYAAARGEFDGAFFHLRSDVEVAAFLRQARSDGG